MSAELQTTDEPPPLAWNEEGQPFVPEKSAKYWRVRRYTGKPGRPPAVWTSKGVLHLPLHATIDDLRLGVNNQPDSYRLYPVDAQGRELSPVAHIELVPEEQTSPAGKTGQMLTVTANTGMQQMTRAPNELEVVLPEIAGRFFDLYERTLTSRDAHDAIMANLVTTLVTNTAGIQHSTAKLLGTATTTIKIANGVQAIEREEPPPLDIDELAARLAEAVTPPSKPESDHGWFVQLLSSPMGATLMQIAQGYVAGLQGTAGHAAPKAPTPPAASPAPPSPPTAHQPQPTPTARPPATPSTPASGTPAAATRVEPAPDGLDDPDVDGARAGEDYEGTDNDDEADGPVQFADALLDPWTYADANDAAPDDESDGHEPLIPERHVEGTSNAEKAERRPKVAAQPTTTQLGSTSATGAQPQASAEPSHHAPANPSSTAISTPARESQKRSARKRKDKRRKRRK